MKKKNMKLRKVDNTEITYLDNTDVCYYMYDYFVYKDVSYSPGNKIIIRYKTKNPSISHLKQGAITNISNEITQWFNRQKKETRDNTIFIPTPPSSSIDDPEYDDRNIKTLQLANVPFANMLFTSETRSSAHTTGAVKNPYYLHSTLGINANIEISTLLGKNIILFDDTLISGANFKACKMKLNEVLEDQAKYFGLFIAKGKYTEE